MAYQANQHYTFIDLLAFAVLYHLIFTAVLCFVVYRNKTDITIKIVNLVAIWNSVVFAFIFARIPLLEHRNNMLNDTQTYIAYYLHILSLLLILYF